MPSQKPDSCFYRNLVHVSTETWFTFPQKPGSCFEKVVGAAPLCFCFWRAIFFTRFAEQFSINCPWFCLGQFPKNRRGKYFSGGFAFTENGARRMVVKYPLPPGRRPGGRPSRMKASLENYPPKLPQIPVGSITCLGRFKMPVAVSARRFRRVA